MNKVYCYSVITKEIGFNTESIRSSYFPSLREARSYFRICMEYYKRMERIYGLYRVTVELSKEMESCDTYLIDDYSRSF